jgi:hypothetical protein
VLRLEDCLLTGQPGVLKEFFGGWAGHLPEGSVLFFGSLSHLAMRGLKNYAEETVRIFKVFSNMLKSGCSIAHIVHAPLGGVQSNGLIRDMYDLDSWLRSGNITTMASLPATRECFWRLVSRDSCVASTSNTMERAMFLQENISNSSKIRVISGSVNECLPAIIEPLSEQSEIDLIGCMMQEIAENYAIEIDQQPVPDRCSGDTVSENERGESRMFVIGASHSTRLVGGLAENGLNIFNLA